MNETRHSKMEISIRNYDPVTQRDAYLNEDMEFTESNFPGKMAWVKKADNVFYYRAICGDIEYLIVVVRRYTSDSRVYSSSAKPIGHILRLDLQSLQIHESVYEECSEADSDIEAMEKAMAETIAAHSEMMMFAARHGGGVSH